MGTPTISPTSPTTVACTAIMTREARDVIPRARSTASSCRRRDTDDHQRMGQGTNGEQHQEHTEGQRQAPHRSRGSTSPRGWWPGRPLRPAARGPWTGWGWRPRRWSGPPPSAARAGSRHGSRPAPRGHSTSWVRGPVESVTGHPETLVVGRMPFLLGQEAQAGDLEGLAIGLDGRAHLGRGPWPRVATPSIGLVGSHGQPA